MLFAQRCLTASLAALLLLGCATRQEVPVGPPEVRKVADELLSALKNREREMLVRFMADKSFFEKDEGYVFEHLDGEKGLYERIASWGDMTYRIDMSKDGNEAVVVYYPRKYSTQVKRDPNFLSRTYGTQNFACAFRRRPEGWLMEYNFCFYETDGYFADSYYTDLGAPD